MQKLAETARLLRSYAAVFALICAIFAAGGCKHITPVDTSPLDAAGMSYDTIQQAKSFKVTAAEVTQLAAARQGGLSDAACVNILQIFHARRQPFTAGDTIAALLRAGISEPTIVALAGLDQLGLAAGELQAMKLAGLTDETILEVARHHAEGRPVFSGASLATMKNAGLRDSTLLELSRRGIPDSQASEIIALCRRGVRDDEILKRFASS